MTTTTTEAIEAIREFLAAFDKKWDGETERKRGQAISPRMEEALTNLRRIIAES